MSGKNENESSLDEKAGRLFVLTGFVKAMRYEPDDFFEKTVKNTVSSLSGTMDDDRWNFLAKSIRDEFKGTGYRVGHRSFNGRYLKENQSKKWDEVFYEMWGFITKIIKKVIKNIISIIIIALFISFNLLTCNRAFGQDNDVKDERKFIVMLVDKSNPLENDNYARNKYFISLGIKKDIFEKIDKIELYDTIDAINIEFQINKKSAPPPLKDFKYVLLLANFNRKHQYELIFSFKDGVEKQKVSVESKLDSSSIEDTVNLKLITPNSEEKNQFGVEYKLQISRDDFLKGKLSLTSEGFLTSKIDTIDLQSSIAFGLMYDLLGIYEFSNLNYMYVLRIKPEFETNQEFKVVDATLKLQAKVDVPFFDNLIFKRNKARNIRRGFFPMSWTFGYTFVKEARDEGDVREDPANRLDAEVEYRFPVAQSLDYWLRWRGYYLFNTEGKNTFSFFETGVIYYLSFPEAGLVFKYQTGELPPLYEKKESVQLGFSLNFM